MNIANIRWDREMREEIAALRKALAALVGSDHDAPICHGFCFFCNVFYAHEEHKPECRWLVAKKLLEEIA